ncbi:hypothetical protein [Chryseobacterium sp. 3008163]|uniref:hypothetical protein n=1 Tax=Chryseobacterium sp. 3008163 TaxID=2478663 RepID=UPI000F0C565F|nr:hypothetical protein [Chryseobacterium sp. 3008163]AYM99603.1 hypothetical protein EAG08_03950 [Chryseobacterium sp. 3008163]
MKQYIIALILLLVFNCSPNSEDNKKHKSEGFYEKCRQLVLSENKVGQEYFFSIKGKEINEINIKYLGNIITSKNDTLKIVNSQNIFGYLENTKKGNGSFYIYNNKNYFIGYYFVGDYWAVPSGIENNRELIFKYDNDFCNQTTKISLRDSIPKKIFIQCTKEGGDLYNLQKE